MEVDQVMESKTGHRISYRCYGVPEGKPIFYFHGWPGSRHEGQLFSDLAKENDCLLVAPERPGYGQSSAVGHLSLRSWALLMGELSDQPRPACLFRHGAFRRRPSRLCCHVLPFIQS